MKPQWDEKQPPQEHERWIGEYQPKNQDVGCWYALGVILLMAAIRELFLHWDLVWSALFH